MPGWQQVSGWWWVVSASLAAWATSAALRFRDPMLLSSLLAPEFERDLTVLDGEHLRHMVQALRARDRFEAAVAGLADAADFSGMQTRVTGALGRLYDSIIWAQRASSFLRAIDERSLRATMQGLPPTSPVVVEIREQLEEVETIQARRAEVLAKVRTTVTGIDTLAIKAASWALGTSVPGGRHDAEVRELRQQLDAYVDGLEEIERSLPRVDDR